MTTRGILLRNARRAFGDRVDIRVRDGAIAEVGPKLEASGGDSLLLDADGALVIPGLIDGHLHLDKTLLGLPWKPHPAGPTLSERIEAEKHLRHALPLSVEDRAANLIRRVLSNGTVHLRTHVDIDPEIGLENLYGVLSARERFKDFISIQIVAFPQSGVVSCPGTAALLDEAVEAGADLVGGLDPAGIDGDPDGQLDAVFDIAERRGVGIDIHLHDRGELGTSELVLIAERTAAQGMGGRVTVSHGFCLGEVDEATFGRTAERLAESGVAILTHGPGSQAIPPINRLRAAGVTVFAGSDNIRDSWSPYGSGDMVERVMWIAYRSGFRTDQELAVAFELATIAAAKALGLDRYGLDVGCRADFVVLRGSTLGEAIVEHPRRSLVVKSGRVVAHEGTVIDPPE
ncbi:MAG: amidohydrolase family protein [Rhodospirillales bacterium]|nr:amidohydrolase family protein [Rhodospirillales bacterium]